MEFSGTDTTEARIAALEKKVRDMEALAKGLIDETVGLRSAVMQKSKESEEISRRQFSRAPVIRSTAAPVSAGPSAPRPVASPAEGSTVIRQKSAGAPETPAAPEGPAMVRIMQSDGTMKMEPRCGDSHQTDSSGGYGPDQRANVSRKKPR